MIKKIPFVVFDWGFISLIILYFAAFVIFKRKVVILKKKVVFLNLFQDLYDFFLTFATLVLEFIHVYFRADSDSAGVCFTNLQPDN